MNGLCVIDHMLRHGADVTVVDHMNMNVLMYGCLADVSNGVSHITEMLLHHLVTTTVDTARILNHRDHNGNTVLTHACMSQCVTNERSFPCIEKLLRLGADPFFVNIDGNDAMAILIARSNGFRTVEMQKDTNACIDFMNTIMNQLHSCRR